mmetsp:Transcript_69403/g.165358  ORF Transcript_69403/g.165358 Transcript_69403/m.165358 type:complete len:222 (+) Transcript_69403:695-1360(+)
MPSMVSAAADCSASVAAPANDVMWGCARVAALCSWLPRKMAACLLPVQRPAPTCAEACHIQSESHCGDRVAVLGPTALQQPNVGHGFCVGEPASSCASTSSEVAVVRAARELSMSRGLTGRLPIFSPTFSWSPACGDSALADRRSVGRSTSLTLTWASLLTADWLREISPGQLNCGTAEALASEGGSGCSGSATGAASPICFLIPRQQPRLPLKSSGRARY